jgi:hypothetical protein
MAVPELFYAGLPWEGSGTLAIDEVAAITHYHQGLPFTAEGRLAVVFDAAVDHYGGGAAPFDVNNRLVGEKGGTAVTWLAAVGYTASGRAVARA